MRLPIILLASLGAASAYQKNIFFNFDPATSGISGRILLDYDPEVKSNELKVVATLDFKKVDQAAFTKAEPKCNGKVTEYAWHIHTKWQQANGYQSDSASLAQCSKAITANHFDPYRSCGPASDYVDAPECAGRPANYKCTPANYLIDPWFCEAGDFSGKFGRFKPKNGKVSATWIDKNFPTWLIKTSGWSIVVHAVCGDATPRVSCARGYEVNHMAKQKKSLDKAAPEEDATEVEEDEDSESPDDEADDHTYEIENKHLRIRVSVENDAN